MTPEEILRTDHRAALSLVQKQGVDRTQRIMAQAALELEERLRFVTAFGAGDDSFTAARMRATLAQVKEVTRRIQHGVAGVLLDGGEAAAESAARHVHLFLNAQQRRFSGAAEPLELDEAGLVDAATEGVRSTILRRLASSGEPIEGADEEPHRAKLGILDRYGLATIGHFEDVLQRSYVTRQPWEAVKDSLIDNSPFLQAAPRYWAERIVRTESMGIYNRAGFEAIRAADDELGDMLKILSATFDERTASDSYAVSGQIRRPDEPFQSWFGFYMHPPNRPNDREVVVPHRMSWPIPKYLAWKSDAEILTRWKHEGRSGSPPSRPLMTTVPLEEIGKKKSAAPKVQEREESGEIPKERFGLVNAPPPPKLFRKEKPPPEWLTSFDSDAYAREVEDLVSSDERMIAKKLDPNDDFHPAAKWESAGLKKLKPVKGSKYDAVLPHDEIGEPPKGFDTANVRYKLDLFSPSKMKERAKYERVRVSDYVASDRQGDKFGAEQNIMKLARRRGVFPEVEDDGLESPLVLRIGQKLYPLRPKEDSLVGAARSLDLKTMHARVIDVNKDLIAHMQSEAEKEEEKIRPREEKRKRAYDEEVERKNAENLARVKQEHRGPKDVVDVRIKHQPSAYSAQYAEKYKEAAPSLGWGHAMQERGLDLPIAHMQSLAKPFEDDFDHPHESFGYRMQAVKDSGAKSVREYLEKNPELDSTDREMTKYAATVLAHVDAIQPKNAFTIHAHDERIGKREETEKKAGWLAKLVDTSVTTPEIDFTYEKERAYCSTSDITRGQRNRALIGLSRDEDPVTVFHEIGHAIEASDRSRGIRASAFLDARTANEEEVQLSKHEKNSRYKPHEKARPDAFSDAYVGKDYGREAVDSAYFEPYFGEKTEVPGTVLTSADSKRTHSGTEVTSMAIQRLGATGQADKIADDPEHFLFGLGQLGGY